MEAQPLSANPKIDIVIPLYNKAEHIVDTLQSVLAQHYQNFSLIIVDDGSTDDSYQQALSIQDPRIKVVQQKNRGVSAARNRGIQETKSDYIAFLDADDYWYPWHLEELRQLISLYPNLGLYSVAHCIRRDKQVLRPKQPFAEGFQGVVDDPFSAFAVSLSLVHSSTACLSRTALVQLGGFPAGIRNGEDVYLWLKVALEQGVAYSTRFCAEYNQDVFLRASSQNDADLPYYLHWLDQQLATDSLAVKYRAGAQRLLWSGLLYNAAGFRLQANRKGIEQISQLSIGQTLKVQALLLVLNGLPTALLRLARRLRHRQA